MHAYGWPSSGPALRFVFNFQCPRIARTLIYVGYPSQTYLRSPRFIAYYYGVVITSPYTKPELFYGHGEGAWSALAWLDGDTLGSILKERRADLEGQPNFLSQTKMSVQLKRRFKKLAPSQSTISNIENDAKEVADFYPEVILELLKLYHFTDAELNTLNERFSLKLPLARKSEYLNNSGNEGLDSAIVWFRDIRNYDGGGIPVHRDLLEGISEDDVSGIMVTDNVLMPPALSQQYPIGTVLFCSEKASPKENDVLAFKYKGLDRYVLLERRHLASPNPVMNQDQSVGDLVSPSDSRLEFLGISLFETKSRRQVLETIVLS